MVPASSDVTRLLVDWSNGNQAALDKLLPLVNAQLRQLARRYMRRESPGHTLQTSALVNEAYLRLIDQRQVHWQNRAHFFGIAAQLMRRILIDHARSHHYAKRGGGALKVSQGWDGRSLPCSRSEAGAQGGDQVATHRIHRRRESSAAI
jgi:RNA polymerase sigma factor (TIGR02999 family)